MESGSRIDDDDDDVVNDDVVARNRHVVVVLLAGSVVAAAAATQKPADPHPCLVKDQSGLSWSRIMLQGTQSSKK